jgi:hypothetical protein
VEKYTTGRYYIEREQIIIKNFQSSVAKCSLNVVILQAKKQNEVEWTA